MKVKRIVTLESAAAELGFPFDRFIKWIRKYWRFLKKNHYIIATDFLPPEKPKYWVTNVDRLGGFLQRRIDRGLIG